MNVISASSLTKRYGRMAAVDNIDFAVAQGEIVGFLGPNGAGKTTTLRMLAGLVRPTSGTCSVLGEPVPGATLLEVGTMIEEPTFYPYLTGRSNLEHAALLHGGVPPRRIDEVLEFVSLQDADRKKVKAYSQGMRQRLALARALLTRPKVLLLDEPTNGLDPSGIAEVREALRAVSDEGVTILVSSHILAEIQKLVDRILAIDKGVIRFDGTLEQLLGQLGGETLSYSLRATDGPKLLEALRSFGYQPREIEGGAEVSVPKAEGEPLVERLTLAGVRIVSASVKVEDLETAYLRIVNSAGRPS